MMNLRAAGPVTSILCAVLAATGWAQQASAVGPEMLTNTSFEQVGEDDQPEGWYGFFTTAWGDCAGKSRVTTERPHSGERAWEISGVC